MSDKGYRVVRQSAPGALGLARPVAATAPAAALDRPLGPRLGQWLLEDRGWDFLRALGDALAATAGTLLALDWARTGQGVPREDLSLLALPALTVTLLYLRGLYRPRIRALFLDWLVPTLAAISVAAMLVLALALLAGRRSPEELPWLHAWLLSSGLVVGVRVVFVRVQRWARKRGLVGRPVLILGAGVVGSQIAQRLEAHPEYGLRPIGLIDDEPLELDDQLTSAVPVVGSVEEVERLIAERGVENLIVAFSSTTDSRVSPLIQRCQELGVEVSVVPRMFDAINNRITYDTVGGMPLLSFRIVSPTSTQFAIKYAIDRVLAALILTALSPLLAAVALAVKLSSPGPILYRQRRVGRDGQLFDVLKFRSMRPAAGEQAGQGQSWRRRRGVAPGGVEGEDRRTWIGKLIRRTGIDELPQLINVVKGEMSLVGPRPERPEFVELFREEITRYGDRLRVKSGITGWAQVHGLRGQTSLAERVEWDNYYISHWSFALDLKILLMTLLTPFQGVD